MRKIEVGSLPDKRTLEIFVHSTHKAAFFTACNDSGGNIRKAFVQMTASSTLRFFLPTSILVKLKATKRTRREMKKNIQR
jgi:hypothetical protein